ncbi:hypothetical protein MUB18_14430 [Sphingobacterium sp. PCS056]|uniref:hypothetical protein n=1 Tax=Sphingobacterium sp. PCS056 TaxID=2931400 RepID=UPI0020107985|nr:hypothetical protein [Sphingobacterium sp. PCS056]UPZ35303.1 hypothetical protein MUB18_14430 [Sphingobacterium sp. PCS056]
MNLGEHYSKSIIRKFDLIPVYYPGTEVEPGDIISYGTTIFDKAKKPFGSFSIIGNITNTTGNGISLEIKVDQNNKSYNFVSENEVTVSAALEAEVPNVIKGDVKFSFGKKGSILLFGVNGKERRIKDLFALEDHLKIVQGERDWNDFYIVTSVITCEKVLAYQSNEDNGSLYVSAFAKNISISGSDIGNVGAAANFSVKWKSKQSFSIDWTENVTLFMKLAHFNGNDLINHNKANIKNEGKASEGGLVELVPKELLNNENL